ncbi:MAG: PKD domain-containing protein, partial [Actinomycetia bacterium]|nr:PKD domain-containing protein [Actinomycetes bacterium]
PIASGVELIVNAAEITDDGTGGEDANPGDNFSVAITPLDSAPDLVIDKDDGGVTAELGGTVVYTLSYANAGPQGATGVEIEDTVPANTTFDAAASTPGWSCADGDPAGTPCTFPIGAIPGDSAVALIDFAVTVSGSTPGGTDISNTATIADDGNNGPDENPSDNTDTEVTPVDQSPTADAGGPYSGDEGEAVALDGSGSTDDLGIALYEWDCTNDGSIDVSSASPTGNTCTYPDNGSYTLRLRVTDTGSQTDEDTATVTVSNVAPEVSANPDDQTVQYSDYIAPVTVTATDVDADTPDDITTEWQIAGGSFASGLPAALGLDTVGCTSDGTTTTCEWTIDGFADVPAGDYTIRVTVADEDGGSTSADILMTVVAEDASVSFDAGNPVAVGVDAPGGDSEPFTLTVIVEETEPDLPAGAGMAGDIGLANVTMSLSPVGPGSSVPGVCAPSGTSGTGYDAALTVDCTFDDVPVNTYVVTVTVDGDYYTGAGEDVLVVYDPSLGFTTGGGWFYWPDTADEATGYQGDKTNFGYTMKYNKKGQKVKGNLLMIRHLADGTIYRVKSNALNGLAIGTGNDGEDFGWASFSGKSTYREPGWADAVGNHTFIVYVEDHGTSGADVDRFWIEIRDKDGAVITASSMLASASTNAVLLGGGNIVVPHDGGDGKGKGKGKP